MSAAHEQPTVVEQEQARQALQLLRDVEPAGETLDVTVAGTAESVHLPRAALARSWRIWPRGRGAPSSRHTRS